MSVPANEVDQAADEGRSHTHVLTPPPQPESATLSAPHLAAEMATAWRRGSRLAAEDLLARHPDLRARRDVVLRLVWQELCLRQEAGLDVAPEELLDRFPDWQAELSALLDCRRFLERADQVVSAKREPAHLLGDCKLLAELGEGAQGRVFLARQGSLADRLVVLKVTPCHGREHLSLARLQHTHIVSLYWVHDDPDHDRRTLCMPYFGSVTLAGLLAALKDRPPTLRTGQDVVDVLDRASREAVVPLPARGPTRQALARASYAQVVSWIGACLADALHYAHERGLLHLDVKPSNVLLASDGQPMLLDFHLAQEPIQPGGAPRGLGGTPLYMAPEQRAAALAFSTRRPVAAAVDGRADVYALGLTLYQALGGGLPLQFPRPPRLDRCNRRVSVGLADAIHKCLAQKPEDRYADAGALAADLRRHLADLPLRGVPNRSWLERWRKWRRRRPQALVVFCMVAALLGGALLGGVHYLHGRQEHRRERLGQVEHALLEGQESLREGKYAVAAERLERGLDVASRTAGGGDLARRLEGQLRQARRLESARRLDELAEAIRFASLADGVPEQELRKLEEACRALWQTRERVVSFHRNEAEGAIAPQVRMDLLDLAVIWVDLRLRPTRGPCLDAERYEALQVLAEAEKLLGPSPVLLWERRALTQALGLEERTRAVDVALAALPPRTAWEHYALGRQLLRAGELDRAAAAFEEAVKLDPASFWPNFYRGVSAYRHGRHQDAVTAFSVCIGAAPGSAPSYHNRALAESALGRHGQALRDYDRALQRDPKLAEAAFNRALLHHGQGRLPQALADVRLALAARPDYRAARALYAKLQPRD